MDPATYEHLRNKTLLFFIEKLLDPAHGGAGNTSTTSGGGGAGGNGGAVAGNQNENNNYVLYTNKRTLHDLSCQFGSKGFTKEMRQIAGGSQSGLKKFLLTYPSIFKIDGDMVSYNVNSSVVKGGVSSNSSDPSDPDDGQPVTSIDNEAVEYFRERLMQYGIGIWVPIKSLLGHRSQAPPHIRHVSGQHIREFTTFLSKYPEVFILNPQDEVLLKEFENYYDPNRVLCESHTKQIDKKRIIDLIEFFANCLSDRGPMLVEQLFCAGHAKFDDDVDGDYFKTPGDLATFFKMYPQCFQVYSNLVTFSDSYKVGIEYLKRQSGTPSSSTPVLTEHPVLIPGSSLPPPPKLIPKPKPEVPVAEAPPPPQPKPIKELPSPKPQPQPQQSPPKTLLKHRVSKILLQAINQNTEHDYKHDSGSPGLVLSPTSSHARSSRDGSIPMLVSHAAQFQSLCESGDTDELRGYILSRTTIVSNQRKATQIVDEIIGANEPVALDFEGINLGNDGQITLVQVGTCRGSVFIFDVLTQPGIIEAGEKSLLGKLLGQEGIVKVMHDCRNDSVNLYRQFGIRLKGVFDTQVAHIVVQMTTEDQRASSEANNNEEGGGKTQNNSKNISLNNLCAAYGTVCNPFKDKVKSVYRHDQKYWSRRPLTKQMIAYASCDVMCLVPSIYETLKGRIEADPVRETLFRELCEEQILTHIEPDEIRSRRRLRKNEADLRALREKLDKAFVDGDGGGGAALSNSSLVLSNREMRLLKHLHLTEDEKEKLKLSLKVAKKLEKMSNSLQQQQNTMLRMDDANMSSSGACCSSDSTSNSELTSLEYTEHNSFVQDPRIAQIDSLEAIINRLIEPNNNEDEEDDDDEGRGAAAAALKHAFTQTLSTGDIVITKVFDD